MWEIIAPVVKLVNIEVKVTGSVQKFKGFYLVVEKVVDLREIVENDTVNDCGWFDKLLGRFG